MTKATAGNDLAVVNVGQLNGLDAKRSYALAPGLRDCGFGQYVTSSVPERKFRTSKSSSAELSVLSFISQVGQNEEVGGVDVSGEVGVGDREATNKPLLEGTVGLHRWMPERNDNLPRYESKSRIESFTLLNDEQGMDAVFMKPFSGSLKFMTSTNN